MSIVLPRSPARSHLQLAAATKHTRHREACRLHIYITPLVYRVRFGSAAPRASPRLPAFARLRCGYSSRRQQQVSSCQLQQSRAFVTQRLQVAVQTTESRRRARVIHHQPAVARFDYSNQATPPTAHVTVYKVKTHLFSRSRRHSLNWNAELLHSSPLRSHTLDSHTSIVAIHPLSPPRPVASSLHDVRLHYNIKSLHISSFYVPHSSTHSSLACPATSTPAHPAGQSHPRRRHQQRQHQQLSHENTPRLALSAPTWVNGCSASP